MPAALLHPFAKPTRESFLRIVRGEGALLWNADGRELVDGMASLWYCAIGHGRTEMADAIAAQVRTLEAYSTFDPFTNDPAEALAEQIRQLAPMADARVFFTCSGSESIDTVMKLARIAHVQAGQGQRKLIISRVRGYHGTAYGGTSAQGIAPNRADFGPFVDEVVQVPADDLEAIATLMSERGNEVAAVIAEPVQGAGGIHPATEEYLQGLRRLCDQHGAYLVFDEVITGFGRLGSWFGAQDYGVTPDFITFAKAVTSGYQPLGGVVVAFVAPDSFQIFLSITFLVGIVVGGLASLTGAIFGAVFIMFIPNVAEQISKSAPWAVYGIFLIAFMYLMPFGISGALAKLSTGVDSSTVLASWLAACRDPTPSKQDIYSGTGFPVLARS